MLIARRCGVLWCVAACALACDAPVAPREDGAVAPMDAARPDAPIACASDADCANPTFCDGNEYCDPSSAAADARGCVQGSPPCGAGELCDEETDSCSIDCPVAPDADGDGHVTIECGGDDCDDLDAARYPGNVEICDSVAHDEDCNPETFGFVDADGDGAGSEVCCNVRADGTLACGGDCNDADGSVSPSSGDGPPLFCDGIDNDCDDVPDEGCPCTEGADRECGTDAQLMRIGICRPGTQICSGGAWTATCSGAIDPGEELCDALDNDCDETVDEAVQRTYYRDADGDGHGVAGTSTLACSPPAGWAASDRDCDDGVASTHPGAAEICNGSDDDCDGSTDEGVTTLFHRDMDGDGFGDVATSIEACARPAGYVVDSTDCDDSRGPVNPAAVETCDGVDNNCDMAVDVGCACTDGATMPCGSSSIGECALGTQRCVGGAWGECVGAVEPRTETCDGLDDDCDGAVDDGVTGTFYRDADGDGFGSAASTTTSCSSPAGYVSTSTDCDDASAGVNPAQFERCNRIDDNCTGGVDEGCSCTDGTTQACGTSDGMGGVLTTGECASGLQQCVAGTWGGCVGSIAPQPESCNGRDDDCDGMTDEGVTSTYYRDADGDGFGALAATTTGCAPPAGYVATSTDCDDSSPGVNPAQVERCNAIDDNCAAGVDEGCDCTDGATRACGTPDGMGGLLTAGECGTGLQQCVAGTWGGCVGAVGPMAESCNGRDDDCDASVDETTTASCYRDGDADGYGTGALMSVCASGGGCPTGFSATAGDCNDGVASVSPGASETCNGLNDDCDGAIDEGETTTCREDRDDDSYGFGPLVQLCPCSSAGCTFMCPAGYSGRPGTPDCDDGDASVRPGAGESCNGVDDDCDATIDEGVTVSCYQDRDGDAFGFGPLVSICPASGGGCPTGYAGVAADCDDADAFVHPGAPERCNGVSDDCDAEIDTDEGAFACARGSVDICTTACGTSGRRDCNASCAWVNPTCAALFESCNYCDDNANGTLVDEGDLATGQSLVGFAGCAGLLANATHYGGLLCGTGPAYRIIADAGHHEAIGLDALASLGYGMLEIEARVRAERISGTPTYGWAVVMYDADSSTAGGFIAANDFAVNRSRRGFAVEWPFTTATEADAVQLRRLSGGGSHALIGGSSAPPTAEHLNSTGASPVVQRLRIELFPDLPWVGGNDTAITVYDSEGEVLTSCGPTGTPCGVNFTPNTRLHIGVTASGGSGGGSRVFLPSGHSTSSGLWYRARGQCP